MLLTVKFVHVVLQSYQPSGLSRACRHCTACSRMRQVSLNTLHLSRKRSAGCFRVFVGGRHSVADTHGTSRWCACHARWTALRDNGLYEALIDTLRFCVGAAPALRAALGAPRTHPPTTQRMHPHTHHTTHAPTHPPHNAHTQHPSASWTAAWGPLAAVACTSAHSHSHARLAASPGAAA